MGETLVCYPIRYWSQSFDLGGFREIVAPEFTARTLREQIDVRALVSHDPARVVGRVRAGTLRLASDRRGLRAGIDLPSTQYARDALESIRRGDAPGPSFGFTVHQDAWTLDADHTPLRTLLDGEIRECSIGVAFPAYGMTEEETASRYGHHAPVEAAAGISDREVARSFARRVRKLLDGCGPTIELRHDYRTGHTEVRRIRRAEAWRPSIALRKRQLALVASEL